MAASDQKTRERKEVRIPNSQSIVRGSLGMRVRVQG